MVRVSSVHKPKEDGLVVFIDESVYSKTRYFRLVLSAKAKDVGKRHLMRGAMTHDAVKTPQI